MKQLKIELSLSEYNEPHCIYLGDSEKIQSFSKTFLKKYLRIYKKVLLDNVRIINNYNSQIYQLYRIFYFDLSDIDIQRITNDFEGFNKSFNWMFDNIGGCQNTIVFNKIYQCIFFSIDIVEILKLHGQKHKNYSLKNQSESYLKMLKDFETIFIHQKRSLDLNRDYTKSNLKLIKKEIKKVS